MGVVYASVDFGKYRSNDYGFYAEIVRHIQRAGTETDWADRKESTGSAGADAEAFRLAAAG